MRLKDIKILRASKKSNKQDLEATPRGVISRVRAAEMLTPGTTACATKCTRPAVHSTRGLPLRGPLDLGVTATASATLHKSGSRPACGLLGHKLTSPVTESACLVEGPVPWPAQ